MTVRTLSLSDLLTDMRIQVECSHVATMPIPLYLRIKETITDMGERHTESKDGEAERNECDCLRRHDSEGMPVGLNPTSPASSDQRGYSVIDSEAMDKLSMDAAETAISHLFFPDDSTRRQQLYQMAHTLRHAFLTLQDKGYLRSPEPVSVDTEIGAEEIWRVTTEFKAAWQDAVIAEHEEVSDRVENCRVIAKACAEAWGLKWQ